MAAGGADFNRAGELAQNGFKKRNLQEFLFLNHLPKFFSLFRRVVLL
jgi:hypothetical protein